MNEEPQGKLLARIALLRQDDQIACICCADQKFFSNETADRIRQTIAARSGIPAGNIMLCASHTHSVPDLMPRPEMGPDNRNNDYSFIGEYADCMAEGIVAAKNHFAPLHHWTAGNTNINTWGICRRPIFRLTNGEVQAATQAARDCGDFVGLDGKDEDTLSAFAAYGNKGIVGGFVNYACHPVTMYGSRFYSADFPGAFYEYMDRADSGIFLYANGPNGNVAPCGNGPEFRRQMGEDLATKALATVAAGEECPPGKLRIACEQFAVARRRPSPRQLQYAREFLNKEEPDKNEIAAFTRKMYGREYHFHNNPPGISRGLCQQLLALNTEMENGITSEEVRIQAIAINNAIAFIGVSAEMFNHFTTAIQAQSPFAHNCIIQQANGRNGYIPPAASYDLGGYECCLSQINRLIPEAFDLIVRKTITILNMLKQEPAG